MATRTAVQVGPFTELMRFIFKNILMHICLSLGLIGNIVTLITLLEKRMRRASTTQYLAAITLFDSIYLICSFVNSLEIIYPNAQLENVIPLLNLFFYPLSDFSGNISIYCILMFTVERYLAVAYPLRSREWCRPSRARKILGLTILFCFIFTFPTFLENKIIYTWNPSLNQTVPELTETKLYPNFDLYKRTYFWIIAVMFQFFPLTLLIVLNSILMKYIHDSTKERNVMGLNKRNSRSSQIIMEQKTSKSRLLLIPFRKANNQPIVQLRCNVVHHRQNEQSKSTILLLATVIIFLICQLPGALLLIYAAIFPIGSDDVLIPEDVILGLNNIANGLVALNASINFILYSCLSEKFRLNFQRIFLFKKFDQNNSFYSSKVNLSKLSNMQIGKNFTL